jgi:HD superfamily phosphohydrolase
MEIRDPVLGPIPVFEEERVVLEHPLFQRLRRIKQLGFSEVSFPGAVHTRHLHSIGVMHLADRAIQAVLRDAPGLSANERERFRRVVRLAGLLHDVGHFPLSHAMESVMPPLAALALPSDPLAPARRASHEDYTRLVLHDSDLARALDEACRPWDVTAADVSAVLDLDLPAPAGRFAWRRRDLRPLLHQVVSSEIDADRMDYLLRDSYFSGVSYGQYDRDWLLSNLTFHEAADGVHLALASRAVFTFDHFLLARYHMFLTVYFHYGSVALERMLAAWFRDLARESPGAAVIPLCADELVHFDDLWLRRQLEEHPGRWGQRVLEGRAPRLLLEASGEDASLRRDRMVERLRSQSIEPIVVESRGELSKYTRNRNPVGIYVKRPFDGKGAILLEEATDLFRRYTEPVSIVRVYGDLEERGAPEEVALELVQSS